MKKVLLFLAFLFLLFAAISAAVALVLHKGQGGFSSEKIALVHVVGPIVDSETLVDEIKEYAEDDTVKAVILRINSPGGAVAPSQEIYDEVRKLVALKPVVTSMASVAASGGYYIAAPSTRIMANPGTLTGSIGVIMEIPNIEELMQKVGIKPQVVKSGVNKDIASAFREMTPEERIILQGLIDDVYAQFVEAVAQSRGMEIEEVRALADGRIYTGRQALELGLVDSLGGLQDAIKLSAELAGISGEPEVITKEEDDSILDYLKGMATKASDNLFSQIQVKYLMSL